MDNELRILMVEHVPADADLIEPELGRGTTFKLYLSRADEPLGEKERRSVKRNFRESKALI